MSFVFEKTTGIERSNQCEKDDVYYWQLWHHNWDDHEIALFTQSCHLSNKRVLEVGCGDGRVSFALAPECLSMLGIDLDQRLIDRANQRLARSELANLKFEKMDGEKLVVDDMSIDVALYPWVLHMVDNRSSTMREAYRVLKPGGIAAVIGIHSDGDYDRIIEPFVKERTMVDPKVVYEAPIREFFGEHVAITPKEVFPYVFETREIAHEAFIYTLGFHYKSYLDVAQKQFLHKILADYEQGSQVIINFSASVYLATK